MFVRRDARGLKKAEKHEYRDALVQARVAGVYQEYVALHAHFAGQFHKGLPFLAWHRLFILAFEHAIRDAAGPSWTLPYWRWSFDNSANPKSKKGYPWRDDLLGGKGPDGAVTGPFSGWTVVGAPELKVGPPPQHVMPAVVPDGFWSGPLKRHLGLESDKKSRLPRANQVLRAQKIKQYDDTPFDKTAPEATSYRNRLEGFARNKTPGDGLHNETHNWTGGDTLEPLPAPPAPKPKFRDFKSAGIMANAVLSPNDPCFWMHHAECDRLWWLWQSHANSKDWWPLDADLAGIHNGYASYTRDASLPPWDGQTYELGGVSKPFAEISVAQVLNIEKLPADLLGPGTGDLSYRYDRKTP